MSQQQQPPQYQAPPPGWYPPPEPKKRHTFLKVLGAVVAGGLILVVGLIVLFAVILGQAADEIKANDERPGGADNPMTIVEGEAFSVAGFDYAEGWKLERDVFKDATVKHLKVTNGRDDKDSALVEIKVWDGKEVKALVDCTTEPIAVGTTVTLTCTSTDRLPRDFSRITINDTF